jgi:hypothetical protein
MFSGQKPFHDIANEYQVIVAIQGGNRPPHPLHDLSRTRGLNNDVWHLIETCWTAEPSERPTATQIVEQLRDLPNQPLDERPNDDYRLPSQVPHNWDARSREPSYSNSSFDRKDVPQSPELPYSSGGSLMPNQVPQPYVEAPQSSSSTWRGSGSNTLPELTSDLVRVTFQAV